MIKNNFFKKKLNFYVLIIKINKSKINFKKILIFLLSNKL